MEGKRSKERRDLELNLEGEGDVVVGVVVGISGIKTFLVIVVVVPLENHLGVLVCQVVGYSYGPYRGFYASIRII